MMNAKKIQLFVLQFIFIVLCATSVTFCLQTDTISPNSFLQDSDTIVSRGNVFKFGFFTPENTTNRYLGIFYTVSEKTASENTIVWVANRDKPLKHSFNRVTISKDGNLILIDRTNRIVWSTNATNSPMNTTVQIQDTGNLVLRDIATGATIWESFSHPCNVFLPHMKNFFNVSTGEKSLEVSWKSKSDPGLGSFAMGLEASGIPQTFIWNNGHPHWRSGPYNGLFFMGIKEMYGLTHATEYTVVNTHTGSFYITNLDLGNVLMKNSVNSTGSILQMLWNDQRKVWDTIWTAPENECEVYGKCGPFGSCNPQESPICSCLRGFEPMNEEEWKRGNWTNGCRRIKQLQCDQSNNKSGDRFSRLQFVKVPDFAEQFPSEGENESGKRCLRNCSCIAYAHDPSIGCMFWSQSLIDVQMFPGVGPALYIRLSASELDKHNHKRIIIITLVVSAIFCMSILVFIAWSLMAKRKGEKTKSKRAFEAGQTPSPDSTTIVLKDESQEVLIEELPLFTFETLAKATDLFHDNNFLGKGGFGPVYKGKLANGKEIAIKRLSEASGQGTEEFMNEVIVISKLQHRNLVKLIGCCVEREEKMLIYEYMPNKSLDVCLFDPTHPSRHILDWTKRFNIIEGIGRGLLYLHRDSRLKIIHRDLKPSNVLLDEDWNVKISDFGMARIFKDNQDYANTARVVGTYGYMAPEYAMEGRFSEKSDVYSFGVLMLEIIKGKKNTRYYNHEWSLSLLGCAWKLWSEGNGLAFVEETLADSNFEKGIMRCIHIALLCVQEFPRDRPTVLTVLSMLSKEIVDLPTPEQPVFAEKWNEMYGGSTQPTSEVGVSINEVTISVLNGR